MMKNRFFLHHAYIDNTLMMKLLAEMKLNNNNIPYDPRRNEIIRTTQYVVFVSQFPVSHSYPVSPTVHIAELALL